MQTMSNSELRREYARFYQHHFLLRGIRLLCECQLEALFQAKRELGITEDRSLDNATRIHDVIVPKYMARGPKALLPRDALDEVEAFIWSPVELFLCVSSAMLQRYSMLSKQYSNIEFAILSEFIAANKGAIDSLYRFRDIVLHPGPRRHPNDAADVLLSEKFRTSGGEETNDPLVLVLDISHLLSRFLEFLHGRIQ